MRAWTRSPGSRPGDAHAISKHAPGGQFDVGLRDVVPAVRLDQQAVWIGDLHVGKTPAQSGHVDPLFGVLVRIPVRPADGDPKDVMANGGVLAASGVYGRTR